MKRLLLHSILFASVSLGQMTHAQLSVELLKDLRTAVRDSLKLESVSDLRFEPGHPASEYLNELWSKTARSTADSARGTPILLKIRALSMSLEPASDQLSWNKTFKRQLELNVSYASQPGEQTWSVKTSDTVPYVKLADLKQEYFPVAVQEGTQETFPSSAGIVLTTAALFASFAALYFIRS